jgi:hypothetical protein
MAPQGPAIASAAQRVRDTLGSIMVDVIITDLSVIMTLKHDLEERCNKEQLTNRQTVKP